MDTVESFTKELHAIAKCKLPISRQKISLVTKSALRALRFYKHVVQAVERFVAKCPQHYKIAGLYTVDAIVRQSLHQFCEKDVFVPRFARQLPTTIRHVALACENNIVDKAALQRVLQLWDDSEVFPKNILAPLIAYVESPLQREHEFQKAQNAANELTESQNATKTQKRPSMASTSKLSNCAPRQTSPGFTPAGNSGVLLPDVLQGTSHVRQRQTDIGAASSTYNTEPPIHSLISSLRTLMQRAGQEKIGCTKQLEQLQAVVISNIQRLSSGGKAMRGAEMTELAQLLAELADRTNAHAQATLAQAQHRSHEARLNRAMHSNLLNDFEYDEEDAVEDLEDEAEERLAREEMRSTEWFVRNLREISHNLTTAGEQQLAAESPPPCPNFALRDTSPVKLSVAPVPIPGSQLPAAAVFDYGHKQHGWDHRDGASGSDAEVDARGSLASLDEEDVSGLRGEKRSCSSRGSSRKRKKMRVDGSENSSKSKERRQREREKERRRHGLPRLRTSRVGVLSRTVFLGRLPKLVDEKKVRHLMEEFGTISALQFVPPRGCAFVTYQRRKHAAKAVARLHRRRLEGREVRVEWAPNKGVNENDEWKSYWDKNEGCAYIPEVKFPVERIEAVLEGGAELDEESLSESLLERIRTKALATTTVSKEDKPASTPNPVPNQPTLSIGYQAPVAPIPLLTRPPVMSTHVASVPGPFSVPPPGMLVAPFTPFIPPPQDPLAYVRPPSIAPGQPPYVPVRPPLLQHSPAMGMHPFPR